MLIFVQKIKKIKKNLINMFLKTKSLYSTHFFTFDLSYYFVNRQYVSYARHQKNHYESLTFDKYGTVNFDSKKFKIDKKRWSSLFSMKIVDSQYVYLNKIIEYCKKNKIKFYFMLTPIREGLYNNLTLSEKKTTNRHILKLHQLLKKDSLNFYNLYKNKWSDSLFVDGIHFNNDGAVRFTNKSFDFFDLN